MSFSTAEQVFSILGLENEGSENELESISDGPASPGVDLVQSDPADDASSYASSISDTFLLGESSERLDFHINLYFSEGKNENLQISTYGF